MSEEAFHNSPEGIDNGVEPLNAIIDTNLKTPEGRRFLWNEVIVEYVKPVETLGLQQGYTSLKEFANHNPLVRKMRKRCNALHAILEQQPAEDAHHQESLAAMQLFSSIDTLHDVIVSDTENEEQALDVVEVSEVIVPTVASETIKRNKADSEAADRYEVEQKTYSDFVDEEEEAREQGYKPIQRTIVKNRGKSNEREVVINTWSKIDTAKTTDRKESSALPPSEQMVAGINETAAEVEMVEARLTAIDHEAVQQIMNGDIALLELENGRYRKLSEIKESIMLAIDQVLPESIANEKRRGIAERRFRHFVNQHIRSIKDTRNKLIELKKQQSIPDKKIDAANKSVAKANSQLLEAAKTVLIMTMKFPSEKLRVEKREVSQLRKSADSKETERQLTPAEQLAELFREKAEPKQ